MKGKQKLQTKTHTNLLPVKKQQTPLLVFIHFFFHPLFEEANVDPASKVVMTTVLVPEIIPVSPVHPAAEAAGHHG